VRFLKIEITACRDSKTIYERPEDRVNEYDARAVGYRGPAKWRKQRRDPIDFRRPIVPLRDNAVDDEAFRKTVGFEKSRR